jgi:hypothetical protein
MPTYTAQFHTKAEWATLDIRAETPQKALQKAIKTKRYTLEFESYGDDQPVEYITIRDEKDNDLAEWQSDELRLEKAASALLDIAEQILDDEDSIKSFSEGFLGHIRAVVAKAKGGTP